MPHDSKYLDVLTVGDANMDVLMRVPSHLHLTTSGERGMGVVGDAYHFGPGGRVANVALGDIITSIHTHIKSVLTDCIIIDDDLNLLLYPE